MEEQQTPTIEFVPGSSLNEEMTGYALHNYHCECWRCTEVARLKLGSIFFYGIAFPILWGYLLGKYVHLYMCSSEKNEGEYDFVFPKNFEYPTTFAVMEKFENGMLKFESQISKLVRGDFSKINDHFTEDLENLDTLKPNDTFSLNSSCSLFFDQLTATNANEQLSRVAHAKSFFHKQVLYEVIESHNKTHGTLLKWALRSVCGLFIYGTLVVFLLLCFLF